MDGLPATAMRFLEFMEAGTGPEGTDVVLRIQKDSDGGWYETEHAFPREFQPASALPVQMGETVTRLDVLGLYGDPRIDPEVWEELVSILEARGRIQE